MPETTAWDRVRYRAQSPTSCWWPGERYRSSPRHRAASEPAQWSVQTWGCLRREAVRRESGGASLGRLLNRRPIPTRRCSLPARSCRRVHHGAGGNGPAAGCSACRDGTVLCGATPVLNAGQVAKRWRPTKKLQVTQVLGAFGSWCRTMKKFVVAWDGIEPPTRGFSIRCSTN